MMALLLSLVVVTDNPTIYIVVDDFQVRSQFARQDMTRDYLAINSKVELTPREMARYHGKVRRLNKIRNDMASDVVFLKSEDVEPLPEYPQYKMGKYGKWHKFPKQAFVHNGWFMLTVARISDEWTYKERYEKFRRSSAHEYKKREVMWRDSITKYMMLHSNHTAQANGDRRVGDALQCLKELSDSVSWFVENDDIGNYFVDCDAVENGYYVDQTPRQIYYKYSQIFPDMPYLANFCPKFPPKTWLPYELDIIAHEGFKQKTEDAYGPDIP